MVRPADARRIAALIAVLIPLSACTRKRPDAAPELVVRELLDRMERADGDPAEMHNSIELLSASTRSNLTERARRASAATGRAVPPEDMLAPARFALRFQPRHMHTHVMGDHALVDVVGIDPETDRAEVTCVLEDGHWRVDVPLPVLPTAEHRPDAG